MSILAFEAMIDVPVIVGVPYRMCHCNRRRCVNIIKPFRFAAGRAAGVLLPSLTITSRLALVIPATCALA